MSSARRSDALRAALAEADRLREEVVRLQARVEELESASLARANVSAGRGLASLIPGGTSKAG